MLMKRIREKVTLAGLRGVFLSYLFFSNSLALLMLCLGMKLFLVILFFLGFTVSVCYLVSYPSKTGLLKSMGGCTLTDLCLTPGLN